MLILLLFLLALAPASPVPSSDTGVPRDVRVGHWLVVKGSFDGELFVASDAELLESGRYDVLIGTVASDESGRDSFRLLGQQVHVSVRTEWKDGLAPGRVAGKRIAVEGRWRGPGKLSAREIEGRGPGRERIGGRVDAVRRVERGFEVSIMRYTILLPFDLEIEHDVPLAQLTLTPEREVTALDGRGADDDDLFGEGIALSERLALESQLEWRSLFEDDFNLDAGEAEDRVDHVGSLRSRLVWTARDDVTAVAELRYGFRARDDEDDGRSSDGDADLGEAFVHWRDAFGVRGVDMTLGRQDFDEPREWIYDQNLDALRFAWRTSALALELSTSTTLADGDRIDRSSTNWIAYLSNANRKTHAALWTAYREFDLDGGPLDENLHVGARAFGEWLPDANVWLDAAHLSGERAGIDVDAWGYDVGITWTPPSARPFSFTAGYAFGGGDDTPANGTDSTFRQTGLHDNNASFDGVTSFRYYGELVDPELSNLGIVTLGVGTRLAERTSLDIVFHRYLQDHAVASLASSDLSATPNGTDPHIGSELDVILGMRESKVWDLELVAAYFDPGAAFTNEDEAFLAKVQLRLRF